MCLFAAASKCDPQLALKHMGLCGTQREKEKVILRVSSFIFCLLFLQKSSRSTAMRRWLRNKRRGEVS